MFRAIWEFIKRLWRAIVDYFNPPKKPTVKITVLTAFLILFFFDNSYAQRSELQYLWAYFFQPTIAHVDYWTINWHNGVADSLDAYKNDSLRVSIRNAEGEWVVFTQIPEELDTMEVRVKLDRPYDYDVAFTFDVIARDILGNESNPSDSVRVHFMVSDINKVINPDLDRGYEIGDNSVDGLDLIELSKSWGYTGLQYTDFVDITGDGYVDGLDLIQLAKDFGRIWEP